MGQATPERSRAVVEQTVREHWGYILAILVGQVHDLELAEDVLQDAAVAALQHWPSAGVPDHPRAWLLRTARRKAIDRFRRDASFRAKREQIQQLERIERQVDARGGNDAAGEEELVDHRLSLIFTCCHPALDDSVRTALTLRTLGGLTSAEISRAYLVPEATMAQRLVRAKRKIKAANIPYRVPPPHLWSERLESVLSVVYFIFNEGYSATSGNRLTRADLCNEALRLGALLVNLVPHEPEVAGLQALMLLHDSRRDARTDEQGNLVTLEDQDRERWNRQQIAAGDALLRHALGRGRPGPYQLQASISAVHAGAPSHSQTDWHQITGLYARLYELQPSWVVKLNEIVALSFAVGAATGLEALEQLNRIEPFDRYQPYHAARADLLRRAGRHDEAVVAYRRAADLTQNLAERRFLEGRLAELRGL